MKRKLLVFVAIFSACLLTSCESGQGRYQLLNTPKTTDLFMLDTQTGELWLKMGKTWSSYATFPK